MIDTSKIAQLYYRYEKRSNEELKNFLGPIILLEKNGDKFYALTIKSKEKILKSPRGYAINWGDLAKEENPIENYTIYKTVTFLVKSSSRFCLKADIGEVVDQLSFDDFHVSGIKGICVNKDEYKLLEGTQGEHFLMTATLFK